ncbi:MAG: SUMF1/EgtB/PvdO family nonheme iron enzyme [Anaerolineae bacterium]|nr:SUMF1/EgtB/PvdO family nonheme iron enzyme [Anaerolineae bacterium]
MPFDIEQWREQVKDRLQAWAQQPRKALSDAGVQTLFGYLTAMTLFPLAEALHKGDAAGVYLVLGSIAGSVGGNLVAEQVQRWKDRADENRGDRREATADVEAGLAISNELRQAIDAILDELDMVHQAHEALRDDDRAWLVERLRTELGAYPGGVERSITAVGDIYKEITVKGGIVGAVGGRGHTINIVTTPKIPRPPAPPDPRRAFYDYLIHVIDNTQHLRLQGIRAAGDVVSIDLEEIYITLDAVQKRVIQADEMEATLARMAGRVPGDKMWHEDAVREREVEVVLSVNQALAEHRRLVILGAPGSGKTTFLNYLALTYARALRNNLPLVRERLGLESKEERRLPILLPLRDFARHLSTTQEESGVDGPRFLLNYLVEFFRVQEIRLPEGFLRSALEAGGAAVLLDGMDEVADPDLRRRVARIIEAFTRRYPTNRYVVTSRLVGYQGAACLAEDYVCATVRDFDRASVERFVTNWSLAVEVALAGRRSPTIGRRAADQAEGLLAAIANNERVRELAVSPLLLTVIALVHRYRAKLPERRAELYEECIEVLLGYWDEGRGVHGYALPGLDLDSGDKRSLLEPVAFWMQERELREVDRDMLHRQLRDLFLPLSEDKRQAGKRAERFVSLINARSGLLQERGLGVYSFSHLTFQEYLAARALAGREDFFEYALARAADDWWREVLLLAAGYLSTQGKQRVTAYVRALVDAADPAVDGPDPYHNLVLAADCLRDVGRARVAGDLWGEVTQRLLREATADGSTSRPRAPVARRVAAGGALGRVGDPRFGGDYLEPELVTVPGGEFWMGSETKDAYGDEKPVHRLYLPTFQIARYPVTNLQYQLFVDANGYEERSYWTEAGWAWRHGEFGSKPGSYRDEWWAQVTGRKSFRHPEGWEDEQHPPDRANHPVVNITWFEALAYGRWLAEVTGKPYRLPTEAEWEKAARGDRDKREYPWGSKFDAAKANLGIGDEQVGSTSPVGIYPGGASLYGVEELSGNVWEWTRSLWGKEWSETPEFAYPYRPEDGREDEEAEGFRLCRGGSWHGNFERFARCSCRLVVQPSYFAVSYGVRMAAGSPSPNPTSEF